MVHNNVKVAVLLAQEIQLIVLKHPLNLLLFGLLFLLSHWCYGGAGGLFLFLFLFFLLLFLLLIGLRREVRRRRGGGGSSVSNVSFI